MLGLFYFLLYLLTKMIALAGLLCVKVVEGIEFGGGGGVGIRLSMLDLNKGCFLHSLLFKFTKLNLQHKLSAFYRNLNDKPSIFSASVTIF